MFWHHIACFATKQHRSATLKVCSRETVGDRHARRSAVHAATRPNPEDINLGRIQNDHEFLIERVSKLPTRKSAHRRASYPGRPIFSNSCGEAVARAQKLGVRRRGLPATSMRCRRASMSPAWSRSLASAISSPHRSHKGALRSSMEYEIGTSRGRNTKVRPDSPLEGTGFEPSVPP